MKVFLDSGAFSAKNQGFSIDIFEYMEYILENEHLIEVYANLDVIGDAEATWKNQETMEFEGFKPLPVFHMEDDIKYLYRCLDYPYFCLGGMAGETFLARMNFFRKCWRIICAQPSGLPMSRVHGFGLTSPEMLRKFPWYSVDSTSWVNYAKFGTVLMPKVEMGQYTYREPPRTIFVSSRRDLSGINKEEHIEQLGDIQKQLFLNYFEEKGFVLGSSYFDYNGKECIEERGLCNDHRLRDQINLLYYFDLMNSLPEYPWPYEPKIKGLEF
jgi:hypothetical protein